MCACVCVYASLYSFVWALFCAYSNAHELCFALILMLKTVCVYMHMYACTFLFNWWLAYLWYKYKCVYVNHTHIHAYMNTRSIIICMWITPIHTCIYACMTVPIFSHFSEISTHTHTHTFPLPCYINVYLLTSTHTFIDSHTHTHTHTHKQTNTHTHTHT